jgi:hypothetical protein
VKTLIIGFGEVGRAHYNILSKAYPNKVFKKDIEPIKEKGPFDLLLIATQCNPADMKPFINMVCRYVRQYKPEFVDVLTTVPCGTCDKLQEMLPFIKISKSSVRGMHPHLDKFLLDITKHIGGGSSLELKKYYEQAGINCLIHSKTRAVELFHILNNFIYGINIMAADECAKYCREMGVDYIEFMEYRKSNNIGYVKAGHPSKVSPVLFPSGGHIGGHCVKYAPTTIPEAIKGPLAKLLQNYGK